MKRFLSIAVCAVASVITPFAAYAAYDKPYIGETKTYRANYEDTFVHLARDYNLGFVEMRAANPGVDPWVPGAGTKIILPTRHILPEAPHRGLVINLPEMRLYYYRDRDGPPISYPIGIGREGLDTPLGTTTVVRKLADPVWRPTDRMRREKPELPGAVGPGPENPMGTHALYLGWPTYAIHGTNRVFGIGRRISSGCIRLYPDDITNLYNMVPIGTAVTVVNQPIKLAWIDGELFIEAHPEVEHAIAMEENGKIPAPKLSQADMERIIRVAGADKDRLHWPAIRTAVRERRGYPISIARRGGAAPVAEAPATKAEVKKAQKAEKKKVKSEAAAALKDMNAEIEKEHAAAEASQTTNATTYNP